MFQPLLRIPTVSKQDQDPGSVCLISALMPFLSCPQLEIKSQNLKSSPSDLKLRIGVNSLVMKGLLGACGAAGRHSVSVFISAGRWWLLLAGRRTRSGLCACGPVVAG